MRRTTAALALLPAMALAAEQTVVGGSGNDYQAAVVVPWHQPERRIAVFERLGAGASGDLWLTRSDDGGGSWSAPTPVIATAANERHASLVQTGDDAYALFHLSNASGGFRIHRATSSDGGFSFDVHGAIDLGWPSGGEINPQVIREADGTLTLVYHRLGGAAYLVRSNDDGATWDQLRTQISVGSAALPRLVHREHDGAYLLVYQTNPGNNQLRLQVRTTVDPYAWPMPPQTLTVDGNNHDAWPVAMPDGRLAVLWARVFDGGFQIHSSQSLDGVAWSEPRMHTHRPGLANIQPYAFPAAAAGHVELYWGAAQVPGDGDYDIVREPSVLVVDTIFADDFEP